MSEFIKAEKIVRTALGLLERETVMANLVWRDAGGDFRGAENDTITVRLPAYFNANQRELRSGDSRKQSELFERSIPLQLTTGIYGDIPITDEELTLDIESFSEQVTSPVLSGVARAIENNLVDMISSASYANEVELSEGGDPYTAAIQARRYLNDSRVPFNNRVLAVGSGIEAEFLMSDRLSRVDSSGSDSALRDATIGRIAGMPVVSVPSLPPNEAYAFHRSAFVLSQRAPVIPDGAPWGQSMSHSGFAIRAVRVFDPNTVTDRFVVDSWMGSDVVTDVGEIDSDGRFEPAEDPNDSGAESHLLRAVKITLDEGGDA